MPLMTPTPEPDLAMPAPLFIDARPRGRWLAVARAAWVLLALLNLALFVISVPVRYAQLRALTTLPADVSPDAVRAGLAQLGLSPEAYAAYYMSLYVALALVCVVVGLVIFWRKSDDGMALFVSLMILTLGAGADTEALTALHPTLGAVGQSLGDLTWMAFIIFFYIFPDGRFVPRWTWLPAALIAAMVLISTLFPNQLLDADTWPPTLSFLVLAGFFGTGIAAQIYRYRRVSGPVHRHQTKWVVFGFTTVIGLLMGLEALRVLVSMLDRTGLLPVLYDLISNSVMLSLAGILPLSMGIAILKYRLYDIDLIIRRTLIYGALTALLLAVYLVSVLLLQAGFRALTGQDSELAIIVSTLAIAALFQPLRHRLQAFIDRRFYRQKYDAAQTLAAFSVHLRAEVNLPTLSNELVAVVQETMQPAHISLWIRPAYALLQERIQQPDDEQPLT